MFRIAVHNIGFFKVKLHDNDTAITGCFANGFTEMMTLLNLNYTLVWTDDSSEGDGKPNMTSGLYNGALGLVQRNQADMMLRTPMDEVPIDEPFYFGPTQRNEEGAIVSKVVVTFNRADVLKSIMCISPTIALLALAALSLIGALIAFNEGNVKSRQTMNVWRLFRLIFAQADYWPIKVLSQALISLVAATSMFFMFYRENSMSTDMFAPDTSQIIRTLDDVLRNKSLKVLMFKRSPIYERFKVAPSWKKYSKIFQMANQSELDIDEVKGNTKLGIELQANFSRRDSVAIHTADSLKILAESTCWSSAHAGNFTISKERFFFVHVVPVYGKNLSHEKREYLDKRFYRAFESGLTSLNFDNYAGSLKSLLDDEGILTPESKIKLENCMIRDLQAHISELQEAHHLDQMSNQALIGLWVMLAAGLAVAALVAAVEKLSLKKKTEKD